MDVKEYVAKIKQIMNDEHYSKSIMAQELGVAFNTLNRLLEDRPISLRTMRKIKVYLENYE